MLMGNSGSRIALVGDIQLGHRQGIPIRPALHQRTIDDNCLDGDVNCPRRYPLSASDLRAYVEESGAQYAYVYLFRSTPMLLQIFLVYYGLGSFRPQIEAMGLWWFFREAWYCAAFAMTLNTAAYQAEILRGAIQSVPRGQTEGAKSLGLPTPITFWKIILPQALIVALRPYGNEIIFMIKGSAVVAVVTVLDLMGQTRYAFSRTFDYQTYLWAAIFYLTIVEALRHTWAWLEARLTRHLKR